MLALAAGSSLPIHGAVKQGGARLGKHLFVNVEVNHERSEMMCFGVLVFGTVSSNCYLETLESVFFGF